MLKMAQKELKISHTKCALEFKGSKGFSRVY